jgi:hypothetical protein
MKFTKDNNSNNRRKLIYWAAGMLSTLVFWRITKKEEKEEKKIEPVKMLTETGELVEIDPRFLAGKGQKIKPEEIHTWVKNRK